MHDEATLALVGRLHAAVDHMTAQTRAALQAPLACQRGCSGCCQDGLTVFEVEAERIRREAPIWRSGQRPGPEGACAFLDAEGACRIYAVRPYVCRTQGLPLRWFEEDGEEVVEGRDICPLNAPAVDLIALAEGACWTIGPVEERLASLQQAWGGGLRRVALRALFEAE